MTIADLRKIIANLPDDMDVRMYASTADEMKVKFAETYPANPAAKYDKRATLMLHDGHTDGQGAGATVIWDEREGVEP